MKKLAILIPFLFAACAGETEPAAVSGASTASAAAPAFTLPDADGKPRSLSEFSGKTVVLEWHNKDCPYVVKHYGSGNMQKLQKTYTAKGVVWLSIISSAPGKQGYVTGAQAAADMKAAGAAPTAVLLDPKGEVGQLYGAKTTPHMFVVSGDGKIVYNGAIDSIRSVNAGDIAKSENYVASALDAVAAGKAVPTPTSTPYGCSVKYN